MLERLAIAFAIVLLGYLAYRAYGWLNLRRLREAGLDLQGYSLGKPAILYFTDPGCAPCKTVQDPALAEVAMQFGDRLQIVKVEALENPGVTDFWGVLSLPTTFIIDAKGQPRGVNHGVARAPKLIDQLHAIGEYSAGVKAASTIDTLS